MRNPVDPDRVDAIAASIDKTGEYWEGTYGRKVEGGFVELAFGHHRADAARKQGLKEIPVTIRKFDDGEMLVWMAQENVRGELPVVIEAVAAAVKALGEGKIKIEAPNPKTTISALRNAPSFIAKTSGPTVGPHTYTVDSIARYLGYIKASTGKAKNSVVAAFNILEEAERTEINEGKVKARTVEKGLASLRVNDALAATRDLNERRTVQDQRQKKTAQEIAQINAASRKAQEAFQAEQKRIKEEREALVRKQAEAERGRG